MPKRTKKTVIKSEIREFVINLRDYFERELQNGGPLLPLNNVRDRVADALGIGKTTVSRITKEKFGESSMEENILTTPNKKRRRKHTVTKPDSYSKEEQDDPVDSDQDTSEQEQHIYSRTYTNRKRCTDIEFAAKGAESAKKKSRPDIDDIKIDYDNIDKFGEQISFLLKRIPRQLCRELQESIVTLVKTETKNYKIQPKVNAAASTSSTKNVNTQISSSKLSPSIGKNAKCKKKKVAIPNAVYKDEQVDEQDHRFTSTIKTFPKPMTVPIELVGSFDCVKKEVLDPGESSDMTTQEQYNEDAANEITILDPLKTDIKIEIEENDWIEQATKRENSD